MCIHIFVKCLDFDLIKSDSLPEVKMKRFAGYELLLLG